jgi:hypothetical protein
MEELGMSQALRILENTDLNTLTPIEAMNLLFEMKKKLTPGQ